MGSAALGASGDLAVGGLAGIRRVVVGVDPGSAEDHLVASAPEASYELVEYLGAGVARCRRRTLDGAVDLVQHTRGGDDVLETEQTSANGGTPARLVAWDVGGLHLEGTVIPPRVGDPPWEMVTFLHGGPVGALAMGEHEQVGAWADPHRATFLPDFPASGICGEAAMLAAFEASELPDEDHEVDAVLAGVGSVVRAGLADPGRLLLVGHSYGAYLVNRALTRTKQFRAAVCWEGVADLRSLDETSLALQARWRGGTPDETPERWSAASPIDRSERVDTPVLLYYGARSNLVGQAEAWSAALRTGGARAEVVVDPAAGHTFDREGGADAFHERVAKWFLSNCQA